MTTHMAFVSHIVIDRFNFAGELVIERAVIRCNHAVIAEDVNVSEPDRRRNVP